METPIIPFDQSPIQLSLNSSDLLSIPYGVMNVKKKIKKIQEMFQGWFSNSESNYKAFIKAMLYGMEATTRRSLLENERRHYQPWQGGAYGGSMEFTAGGKTYRAERTFGSKEKDDTFALYDLSTGLLNTDYSERLGEELFHIDRGAWERSCYLGQRKLEVLVNDSLHARLSHAEEDAGDIENYERAAASLEERMKFLKKTGNRGEIAKLQEERRQVREQMEAYEIQQEKLWKAQQELLEKRLKEQEEKLQEANVRLAGYEELPMKEQELDRLREQIFRFQAAQEREQTAKQQYMQAQKQEERRKAELEEVRECAQEQKYSDRKWMLTGVTGLIVMLTGIVLMVCCFSDNIFMTALLGILILLGLVSTIISFLQLCRNQRSCHLAKEIYNQHVAELQQYQKQSKQLKKQWDEAEAERKEQEQDPILQKLRKATGYVMEQLPDGEILEQCWQRERERSREFQNLRQSCENHRKEVRKCQQELDSYEQQGKHVGQTEVRLELEEKLTDLSEQIQELERKYELLSRTLELLKTARDRFLGRYLTTLKEKTAEYLAILEPAWKDSIEMDVNLKLRVRQQGILRDPEYFSTGWQDLFRLAQRFALMDALCEGELSVAVLDDPFVNLDEEKRARTLELLNQIGKQRQIIYFTCRR